MITQDTIRPKTILIVEDNALNMRLWNDVLEAQGYALLKTKPPTKSQLMAER